MSYIDSAIERELDILRSTQPGNQDNQINASAFKLAQLVKAGVDEAPVRSSFYDAVQGLTSKGKPWTRQDAEKKWRRAMREAQPRQLPAKNGAGGGHWVADKKPEAKPALVLKALLSPQPIPKWTAPTQEARYQFVAGEILPKIAGELRRHIYYRGEIAIRIKIKFKKDGGTSWLDAYKVAAKAGMIGWQYRRPATFIDSPYFLYEEHNPFDTDFWESALYQLEGEKDAESLARKKVCAFSMGASTIVLDCGEFIHGRNLIILGDNDDAGRKFVQKQAALSIKSARSVKVYTFPDLPEGGDVSDFLETRTLADLEAILEKVPYYEPDFGYGSTFYSSFTPSAPVMIVKRLLPADPDALLFVGGQSEAGKTYLALGLALAAASGVEFLGFPVRRRAAMIYAAAEGQGTIGNRIIVASRHMGIEGADIPLHVLLRPGAINEDVGAFAEAMARISDYHKRRHNLQYAGFVLDTLSSGWHMEDKQENDAAYVAATCQALREIGRAIGGPVIIVHHYGKSTEAGLRGSSNWKSQCDQVITILAKKDEESGEIERSLELSRSRYGPTGNIGITGLHYEPLGTNADGDEFGDCSLFLSLQAARAEKHPFQKTNYSLFEECVLQCLAFHGIQRRVDGDGPMVNMVKLSQHVRPLMRTRFLGVEDTAEKNAAAFRQAWKRCLQSIDANKFCTRATEEEDDNWVWQIGKIRA